ncbi:hypothetical protein FI667_g366, partial [Globisporangium splendens]
MTSMRKFCCDDLFRFNNVNLDVLTETYNMSFYLQYLSKWPDYFLVQEDPNNTIMGYSASYLRIIYPTMRSFRIIL